MQMQSDFFYVNEFAYLIKSIAQSETQKTFKTTCNTLLEYLNKYRSDNPKRRFSRFIKNLFTDGKLNDIDECWAFIEQLKEIPTNKYSQWGEREHNILNFIGKNEDIYKSVKELPNDKEDINKPVKGLPNDKNACYIISALQCLYDDHNFRKLVLNSNISGSNSGKMQAVKEIFKHLNGDINLTTMEIGKLYKSIGYNGTQEESDRIRRQIRSWFIPVDDANDRFEVEYLFTSGDFKSVISDFYHENKYNDDFSPRIIEVNIGRGDETGKNGMYIQIPERLKIGKLEFLLHSATVHHETRNGGHYISYVKKGNKWICRNDLSVTAVSWKQIKNELGNNSEFLRYERIS
jgi:hypothetical protein